ncbi:hypothetical protein I4I73_17865 [Pseudonocardia sp. KRD-184]|uniref:Uncharacterized protein n=1 Tax=Pseudonocardia oceani TaxID=2792013 RepID=A0ABS6U8G6_9PSEU|nr:hypothetical protein [Pseudonocardia oceani]MBW0090695.1 hypothetical protein [Pseudonocardia oceani]MBW0097847.1 hypothetical protein [Pseudonocardia oceani]MBW0110446.1 hypothetical protein [Pseudonocardia oceani]MBW0121503.1 hypothetical protein [Pseudonocardia oceani]MBW0128530.1 hypothetical protein [Pseudonocardia oceani]
MQLALTPEVLVPVGAGALLLVIALVAVLLVARRRRRARALAATVVDTGAVDPEAVGTAAVGTAAVGTAAVDTAAGGPAQVDTDPAADEADPDRGTGHDGAWSDPTERVGSGRTVAAAVAQALAAREAHARAGGSAPSEPSTGTTTPTPEPASRNGTAVNGAARPAPDAAASVTPDHGVRADGPARPPETVTPDIAPSARGDARDRLLAVLLDDPVRAVGATVELDACRRQLARLTDSVRHEREALRSVLARLAETGLGHDQLARLSGLSDAELRDLLPDRVGVG